MKKIILLGLICFLSQTTFAQSKPDSLSYQLELKKINNMLAQRALKLVKYHESLDTHSGIFGTETKKDIRRSHDILVDIVNTDNAIYAELKILFELRSVQPTHRPNDEKVSEANGTTFVSAVNKLSNQIDQLRTKTEKDEHHQETIILWGIIAFILMLGSILYLLLLKNKVKA